MGKPPRKPWCAIRLCLLFALLVLASQVSPCWSIQTPDITDLAPVDNPSPSFVASQDSASFIAGPCVDNVAADSAVLLWETSVPCSGKLIVSGPSGAKREQVILKPRAFCEMKLTRLAPDTVYHYEVALSDGVHVSQRNQTIHKAWFRTFPVKPRPIKFIVYGDSRTGISRHAEVIAAIAKEMPVDFVLHTGDMVERGLETSQWFSMFFRPIRGLADKVPFFTVLGNHEGDSSNYFRFLSLPGNERYYSFNILDTHIIALDSNIDFSRGSAQYKWLVDDLEKSRGARHKFIFLHHPPYSSGPHGAVDSSGLPMETGARHGRQVLVPLAAAYGVEAVFSGHEHFYERSEKGGIQYIVAGGGGAPGYGKNNADGNPYSKVFAEKLHYCVVSIDDGRAQIVVKGVDGSVIDKVQLREK